MREVQKSSNPKIRTHLFGIASDYIINGTQPYSSDSTTHVQLGAYGKIMLNGFHQPVIVSDRQLPRTKIQWYPEYTVAEKEAADAEGRTLPEVLGPGRIPGEDERMIRVDPVNGTVFRLQECLPYKGGEEMYQQVKKELKDLHLDIEDVIAGPYARTAVNMWYLQHRFDHVKERNVVTHKGSKKLF